jgi:uncharacterized protein (TIGR03067 family)
MIGSSHNAFEWRSTMHARRWLVLAALAAFTAETGARSEAPVPAKVTHDLKQLQGTWTLIAYSVDGRLLRGEDSQSILTIEDDRWRISWRKDSGEQQVEQGVVRTVATTGSPRVMDLVHDFGPYRGMTTRAFYQVEGDTMRYSTMTVPASIGDAGVITATTTWKRKPH